MTPIEYQKEITHLCESKRGQQGSVEYISAESVVMQYEIPLSEMITDFYD